MNNMKRAFFISKIYYVYIMTNKTNSVLYTGITYNLEGRVSQHKNKELPGFTSLYNINKLIYNEEFDDVYNAITREKEIKGWLRKKKIALIEKNNPDWKDLSINWHTS